MVKIRDIGIYDGDELLVTIYKAKSYKEAISRFKSEYPNHPAHTWNRGYSVRNMLIK